MQNYNNIVKIDDNHLSLIYSLIISHKPKNCLELGIGSGITTEHIIKAFIYNNIPLDIDCVDSFYDWQGICPPHISNIKDINLMISEEEHYVVNCPKKYDFIVSDADHFNSHKWIKNTFNLLNINGIIVFHDITNKTFPNLYTIVKYTQEQKYNYMLFNTNSRTEERCDRGMLIVKP